MGVWDGFDEYQQSSQPKKKTSTPVAKKPSSGGVGGFLYNTFIKPAVDSTIRGGQALTELANTGKISNKKQFVADIVTTGTSFVPLAKGAQAGQGVGRAMVQGAKAGAAAGGAQGAANAYAQDGGAEEIISGGVNSALVGAATGGALGAAGRGLSKMMGGRASNPDARPGRFDLKAKVAARQGRVDAKNTIAQEDAPFVAAGKPKLDAAVSYSKDGLPVGKNEVQQTARGLGLSGDVTGLGNYSEQMLMNVGGHLNDMTRGVRVNASNAAQVGTDFVRANPGLLGKISKNGTGAAYQTNTQIREGLKGLGPQSDANEVLQAISRFEQLKSDVSNAAQNGDLVAKGQEGAYKAVLDHLHGLINNHPEINTNVEGFRLSPTDVTNLKQEVAANGGTEELGQAIADALNNARTYQDLRSAMQPAMVAKRLAKLGQRAEQSVINKPVAEDAAGELGSAAGSIATSGYHPVATAADLSLRAAGGLSRTIGKTAKKLSPDAYREAYDSTYRGVEAPPAKATAASAGKPEGKPSSVLGTLAGQNASRNLAAPAASTMPPPEEESQTTALSAPSGMDAAPANESPYGIENLMADIQRDPKHMSDYLTLYKTLNAESSKAKSATAAAQKQLMGAQEASDLIDNLEAKLTELQSGGNVGLVGGNLSSLMGNLNMNPAAKTYNDTRGATALMLIKAIQGSAGQISDADRKAIESNIPNITDDPDTQGRKLTHLREIVDAYSSAASGSLDGGNPSYSDNTAILEALGLGK